MPAADFAGCVKTLSKPIKESKRFDFLGKPIIPGWYMQEDVSRNVVTYSNFKNIKNNVENVVLSNELGWDTDFIESQAFAYLAIRKIKNLHSTYTETTGVKIPTVCGAVSYTHLRAHET